MKAGCTKERSMSKGKLFDSSKVGDDRADPLAGIAPAVGSGIRPEQLSAAELDEFNGVVAAARDTPAR